MKLRLFKKHERKLFTIPIQAKQKCLRETKPTTNKKRKYIWQTKTNKPNHARHYYSCYPKTSAASKRTIDSIAVKGYQKFPASFIKYYAGIKKGAVFDSQQVVEKNNALNSLGFANSIKPPKHCLKKKKQHFIYI